MARNDKVETRREMVRTGNPKLPSKTIQALRNTNSLLALRKTMGVSASGLQSPNCMIFYIRMC